MDYNERIRELAREQRDYVIKMRRYFHENPELGEREENTSSALCRELADMGISFEMAGEYGIIARFDSGRPGKTLLIRSDMDGLPITEDPENLAGPRTCVSKTDGVSHLCGHDGHMAVALGTAPVLWEMRKDLKGRVLFCFEQAEEHGGGIDVMLECLKPISIDYSYGIHLYAGLDSGLVSVQQGPRMASVAGFIIRIRGRICA